MPQSQEAGQNGPAAAGRRPPTSDDTLIRIAAALERLSPGTAPHIDFRAADAFIWQADGHKLTPVPRVNRMELELLKGIDRMRDTLIENTERFATRAAGQQCAALGRARHGQIVAGQGRACQRQCLGEEARHRSS